MNGVCWCICRIPRKSTLLESFLFFRSVEWNRQRKTTDTCFTRSLQNMLHSGEVDQVFFERAQILQRDNMYLDWISNTSKYYIRGTLCVWGNGTGGFLVDAGLDPSSAVDPDCGSKRQWATFIPILNFSFLSIVCILKIRFSNFVTGAIHSLHWWRCGLLSSVYPNPGSPLDLSSIEMYLKSEILTEQCFPNHSHYYFEMYTFSLPKARRTQGNEYFN